MTFSQIIEGYKFYLINGSVEATAHSMQPHPSVI